MIAGASPSDGCAATKFNCDRVVFPTRSWLKLRFDQFGHLLLRLDVTSISPFQISSMGKRASFPGSGDARKKKAKAEPEPLNAQDTFGEELKVSDSILGALADGVNPFRPPGPSASLSVYVLNDGQHIDAWSQRDNSLRRDWWPTELFVTSRAWRPRVGNN